AAFLKLPEGVFFDSNPSDPYVEWAFFVKAVPGASPGYFYEKQLFNECQTLFNLISNWSKIADASAFDDCVANQDRHAGNILVSGLNEVYLIDHSNLPVTLNWSPSDLDVDMGISILLVI